MIAISYRREDSQPVAGRLYDRLQARFGTQNVFMDFDSIPPGVDFREQIKRTIERSSLVIAVIGPRWLGVHADSSRRIDDPTDFVRLEIKYALEQGVPIIPLLIDHTLMPKPEKLPADIEELAFRNALPLDSGLDFHTHAERLINGICGMVRASGSKSQRLFWFRKRSMGGAASTPALARRWRFLVRAAIIVSAVVVVGLTIWFFASNPQVETDNSRAGLTAHTPTPATSVAPVKSSTLAPQSSATPSTETSTTEMVAPSPYFDAEHVTPPATPVISQQQLGKISVAGTWKGIVRYENATEVIPHTVVVSPNQRNVATTWEGSVNPRPVSVSVRRNGNTIEWKFPMHRERSGRVTERWVSEYALRLTDETHAEMTKISTGVWVPTWGSHCAVPRR